jgi:hypothetical protein
MADHLSQSNTKSVIEHEGTGRRGGMHRHANTFLPHGLMMLITSWNEIVTGHLIWHLKGDLGTENLLTSSNALIYRIKLESRAYRQRSTLEFILRNHMLGH